MLPFDTVGRVLNQTSSVEVIQGQRGFWMQTEVKGQKGWIFSGFVITSTNVSDLSPMTLETDPERLPLFDASLLQGAHSVEKLELPAFVVEGYAFPGRENATSEQLKTAEGYNQYCDLPVSLVVFRSKNTGRVYAWRAYSEQILKRDYPLPGMVTTMGAVCNCCCAGGAERYYAFEEDHVAAIPLHLHPSKKASCFYSNAPYGPIQPAVEVRRSANVLYTFVKVPICEPTPEQNALLKKGEELLVEDVRLFSSISFTRLEVTASGFNLIRRQVASVPDEFRAEWDQAELLEEP